MNIRITTVIIFNGNCVSDCPCASGYTCKDNICTLSTTSEPERKFPLKIITVVILIFITLGVIMWLIKSLKEEDIFKKVENVELEDDSEEDYFEDDSEDAQEENDQDQPKTSI
jgi:hypothetical protein